jgi:hypothetical protein
MRKAIKFLYIPAFAAGIFIFCTHDAPALIGKQPDIIPRPVLSVYPRTITIQNDTQQIKIFVSADPQGLLPWRIDSCPAYLVPDSMAGTIDNDTDTAAFTCNVACAKAGANEGRVTFIAGADTLAVSVSFTLATKPAHLEFSYRNQELSIVFIRQGWFSSMIAEWNAPWLMCAKDTIPYSNRSIDTFYFSVDFSGLGDGTYGDTIVLRELGESQIQKVPVWLTVSQVPALVFSPRELHLDMMYDTGWATIANIGCKPALCAYSVPPGFTISNLPDSLAPGDSANLVITFDSAALVPGSRWFSVIAACDDSITDSIRIHLTNDHEPFFQIDHAVLCADYTKFLDLLVTIADTPACAFVIDPAARQEWPILLSETPRKISLSPDGKTAVVCHDSMVSIIDVQSRSLDTAYSTSYRINDAVTNGTNVYMVAMDSGYWKFRVMDVATGRNQPCSGSFYGSILRMHPSGRYMYSETQGLSPQDIDKFQLDADTSYHLYDSRYHGDYGFGMFWFSEHSDWFICETGNIFTSTEDAATDITFIGKLDAVGFSYLAWADPNAATGLIYTIPAGDERMVLRYGDILREPRGAYLMPLYPAPVNGAYVNRQLRGKYVFSNSMGSRIFVLGTLDFSFKEWGMGVLRSNDFK